MTKDGCNCHIKDTIPCPVHHNSFCKYDFESNYGYADLVPGNATDPLNPFHYSVGDEQVWDFIARKKLDYFEGNVVKYVCRSPYKGEQIEDLKKAIAYLRKKIELLEGQRQP